MGKQYSRPPAAGDTVEHSQQLDTTWKPGPGQKWADAPHVVMEISRVQHARRVWYRPQGGSGPGFVADPIEMGEGGPIVREWLRQTGGEDS